METSVNASESDLYANPSSSESSSSNITNFGNENNSRQGDFGMLRFPALNFFQSPLSFVLDYSGILRSESRQSEIEAISAVNGRELNSGSRVQSNSASCVGTSGSINSHEVSIRISGSGESEEHSVHSQRRELDRDDDLNESVGSIGRGGGIQALDDQLTDHGDVGGAGEGVPLVPSTPSSATRRGSERASDGNSDSSYRSYDSQQVARWIEQLLPFSLLLLAVLIRQHLQGFFIIIWISAVMFKSNDIVRKQTALKGERKVSVLGASSIAFMLQVVGSYWWCQNDDLLYPLFMLPPKEIPSFWDSIFIVLVNDTLMRQLAMAFKCFLLIYYKNGRGHNFRQQGRMLTLLEYTLLLYRALLPTPVWYRFFLNNDYGSLFSSLTTGLYLTFKLMFTIEKVQCFFAAIRALSRKEVHYGSYATLEQVNASGDLCAICQEKMLAPIVLCCEHIFCDDCVSEWFERERTCPLCRALVKPADLPTFGHGSTSLFFQLF